MHEVLVNRFGGLSLPRKSVVRLTDRPDMTLDVYRGRKTTMQQCNKTVIINKTMIGLEYRWDPHKVSCTTIHRYPIFSTRYSVMCKVYTGYCGTSEIEHGLCACTVDNPLAKARGLSLHTGAQTMLYLSLISVLLCRSR